jgi:hypothetical protein
MYQINDWNNICAEYNRSTLILGNGASIAVSRQFNYQSLLEHAFNNNLLNNEHINELFYFFETNDFELILRRIWQAHNVNQIFRINNTNLSQVYEEIRNGLIATVRSIHPSYQEVEPFLNNIYNFIKQFDTIISLNYDLIIYWALMHGLNINDGFSLKDCFINRNFDENWKRFREPIYGNRFTSLIFYLHGNLALGKNFHGNEYKIENNGINLLNLILDSWSRMETVPLFISEGTAKQKINSIHNSFYFSTIYREVLPEPKDSLVIYGWGIGPQDLHLLEKLRNCGIRNIAVSVYNNNQDYCQYINATLQRHFGNINIQFFDSNSSNCWIHP